MERSLPRGLMGATGGVLGAIPLLPIARTLALKVFPAPQLPGAALRAANVKGATYCEATVLLVAVPLAALFFGHVLPRLLESRAGRARAGSEWPGACFALSFVLWRSGLPAKVSLSGGLLAVILASAGALGTGLDRLRALFSPGHSAALSRIFLAGAFWGLAWKSGHSDVNLELPASTILAGALFVSLALLLLRAGQEDTG